MKQIVMMIVVCSGVAYASEWNPSFYNVNSQTNKTEQMVGALRAIHRLHLTGNETILDVGCGDGKITQYIASLLPECSVHGIDKSADMIAHAQTLRSSNLSFEAISLFDFKPAHQYDIVVCFTVLYLFSEYEEAFQKVLSFVKPGGAVYILQPLAPLTPLYQFYDRHIAALPVVPSLKTVMHAIFNANVSIEYLCVEDWSETFKDAHTFFNCMAAVPFFSALRRHKNVVMQKMPELVKIAADGTVSDSALSIWMILKKGK